MGIGEQGVRDAIKGICRLMVSVLLVFGLTETAFAAAWGPKTSSYNGSVRVEGWGTLSRLDGGSRSVVYAKDRNTADKNPVYGYTNWYKLTEVCTSFGGGKVITGSVSSCATSSTRFGRLATSATYSGTVSGTRTQPWCDSNGRNCADYGLKVVAGACAQMGFPVPDSCTYAYVEYHRP